MEINIFWFRRDLRLFDNAGLYSALKDEKNVQPLFIFDKNILDDLKDKKDPRLSFIYKELKNIDEELKKHKSRLWIYYGRPVEVLKQILKENNVNSVYANRDYEPYALERDSMVSKLLKANDVKFYCKKDHVIFDRNEVVKKDGGPYVMYTPYKNSWLEKLKAGRDEETFSDLRTHPCEDHFDSFRECVQNTSSDPSLNDMGFEENDISIPSRDVPDRVIRNYESTRDYPAKEDGTSRLGIHLRFGTVSIRQEVARALKLSEVFLSELIWREFFSQILFHYPHVITESFRPEYDKIEWRNNEREFELWCSGHTGYPLVDAGMQQLNTTGFMHNRVRMVTASFLTKHLLIDWRWGEAYFAEKLFDYDLASNNGNWQWVAGCGTDAAPYFRIFNPESQLKKFDPAHEYVNKYVEKWSREDYPEPIVDHKKARERCLKAYKKALHN